MQKHLPLHLFLLLLFFSSTKIKAEEEPIVTMVTEMRKGDTFSFALKATEDETSVNVDFGDGTLVKKIIGIKFSTISGRVEGNTLKIYGSTTGISILAADECGLTELDVSKNKALTGLFCQYNKLQTLNISNNIALTDLRCYSNKLTSLDVSNNIELTYFLCNSNQLASLDVSNNTALRTLSCDNNQLTSLDLNNNNDLNNLYCQNNQITSLDISNNIALTQLYCNDNKLTSLEINNNIALKNLGCNSNQLTNLNITSNPDLGSLGCSSNQLKTLDVSNNKALTSLYCHSNLLTALDVSNNKALKSLSCELNALTFSTLILGDLSLKTYCFLHQDDITIPQTITTNTALDLSSESQINGTGSIYTWKTASGTVLKENEDYTITNGITTFKNVQSEKVYCQMTNTEFPTLVLNTTQIEVSSSTGINEESDIAIEIYPNPVFDKLNIKGDALIKRVEVVSLTGSTLYHREVNNTQTTFPTESFTKGIYILKLETNAGAVIHKFVKK